MEFRFFASYSFENKFVFKISLMIRNEASARKIHQTLILQPLASIQRYYIDFRNPRLLEPGESSALPLPWISAAGVHPTPGTFSSFFSFERHVPWWVERLQPGWELLLTLPLAFTTAKENRSFHLSKSQLLHHCSNLAKSSSHSRVALSKGADAWKQTLDTSGCEIQF